MGKGKTIAGFVLSIVGVVCGVLSGYLSLIGLPVSVVGLVLAIVGGKQLKAAGQPTDLATAGLVIGIVATVFSTIAFFTCGLCIICGTAIGASGAANAGSLFS